MDIRSSSDFSNRNNLDSELGTLERFEVELKTTVFGVLFVLLKETEISIYTALIISVIQFLQLLIFPFHDTIKDTWNQEDVVDVIHSIVNYLNIVSYIDDANYNIYITIFYVLIVVLCITLAIIIYVSFAFTRKKLFFSTPVLVLKYIATLSVTILYLPFMDYFVSILACVGNTSGKNVHSFFTEIECWTGTHILHVVFAVLGAIVFFVVCSVTSLTFFEYKSLSNDPTARVSARASFLLILYKTIMIICLRFLTGDQFQVLLLAMILIGSFILFMKFYFNSAYHNEVMAKVWASLNAINLWTAVMLVFAKVMETTLFEGSIIAWLLGIPFVILIILTSRDHRIDLLLINVNKFQSGQEVQDQIRYLLKLVEWQATHRNSAILLDGYIEIHKQSCNKDDCPLKQKIVKNNRFAKNLMNQDETLNEKYALLIQLLYKMYSYGIKKFPNNTSLRIAYAFFLLEKMQSKQQALQELTQAEQNKPPFDEQFIIFRYKKIIEDEIAESQAEGQGGLDVVSESAFQNHLRQLQANIEKSALLHMEFWSQLSEDNPDLGKLNDSGSKINSSVTNVEDHWTKLLKINANNAKAMRLYGKFLIEIINDKEAGDNLLDQARNLSNNQNKKIVAMTGNNGDDSNTDSSAAVWVSGEQDKFGMITGINLAAASLFGYNKTELLNRKVNVLMPQIFAKHHDSFLETYLNLGEGNIIGKNKERLVFGKNKANYIFPIFIQLKAVQSIIQGIQFVATFRVEKNFKNAGYVLTHPDGTIDALSSSAINLLKIDLKMVNQRKANIQDFIPNLIKDRYSYFSSSNNAGKASATITYNYPRDSEYFVDGEPLSAQLHVHLNELVFLGGRENAGFQFKFERIADRNISVLQADKKARISNFQFKFDKSKALIIGEYVEGSTTTDAQSLPNDDDLLSGIQNTDQGSEGKDLPSSAKPSEPEEPQEEIKKDYGLGIKTLRLIGGKPQEIEDNRDSEEDESGEGTGSKERESNNPYQKGQPHQQLNQQEEEGDDGSFRDFNTTFKSRKALSSVVNDKTPPSSVANLRWAVNFLGIALFVIALVDYLIASSEFDNINDYINLLDSANSQVAAIMSTLGSLLNLNLLGQGLLNVGLPLPMAPSLVAQIETALKEQLTNALDEARTINQFLSQQTGSLSDEHQKLLSDSTSVILKESQTATTQTTKSLIQATDEVISRAYSLGTMELVPDQNDLPPNYWYVRYNTMNQYYEALRKSSEFYAVGLTDQVRSKRNPFLLLLVASFVALVLALIVLFPILYQVNKIREEVLSLFLDIPEKTVKGLYNKCETFISNLQVGEDDEMITEVDEEELEKAQNNDHEATDFIPRRRRKRFKNSGRSQQSFFLKSLVVALVLEGYFLYTFISAHLLLSDVETLIPELNSTSVAEPFFWFSDNTEKQLFLDNARHVLEIDSEDVATDNIKKMYDLDSLILEEHSINRKIHSDTYATIFNDIMMSNPCPYITNVTETDCAAFADGTVAQGMTVALSRHFENLRTLLSCYSKLEGGATSCTNGATVVDDLLRNAAAYEINAMQHYYISGSFKQLMTSFKESIADNFSKQLTIRLIVFIIFIVVMLFIYIFIWQTLVRKIINDIWRTKAMLNMIPLNVIAKIKSIRLYLKRFWNQRNLANA